MADGYIAESGAVFFDMKADPKAAQQWICSYIVWGKAAKFRLRLGSPTDSTSTAGGFTFKFGKGEFIPEAGSDSSALLADLAKAIEAKAVPSPVTSKTRVPFTYANLGDGLSLGPGGGLNRTPPGGWTAMKIFLGEGDEQGELYLNFNSGIGKGQFSMKDPEYGDIVLAELAKAL